MQDSSFVCLIDDSEIGRSHLLVPKEAHFNGVGESDDALSISIEGRYEGALTLGVGSTVVVQVGAFVCCSELMADHILIHGHVQGNVVAGTKLELGSTALVNGSISYAGFLAIHPGAKVSATLEFEAQPEN